MMGAWRYTTENCRRIWRFYAAPGPAERVVAAPVDCVRIPGAPFPAAPRVPAFIAAPPATAAALPKLAVAAGLGTVGAGVGAAAFGVSHLVGGPVPASAGAAAVAPVSPVLGRTLADMQIPAPGVRTADAPPVTSVPEPASGVLLVPVLVVVLLGRGFRRA